MDEAALGIADVDLIRKAMMLSRVQAFAENGKVAVNFLLARPPRSLRTAIISTDHDPDSLAHKYRE
jgi:hypothetical protein